MSIDVELLWGLSPPAPPPGPWRGRIAAARQVMPRLLALLEAREIRATWAVLGLLFCRNRPALLAALPERLPAYQRPGISPYTHLAAIGDGEADDPLHYGSSLVDAIAARAGQEIGTATFGRYLSGESGQTRADFEADLQAALAVARRRGMMVRSLVFPADQVRPEYLPTCRRLGIAAYRGPPPGWPYGASPSGGRAGLRQLARGVDALIPLTGTRCVAPAPRVDGAPVNIGATRRLRAFGGLTAWTARAQRRRIFLEMDRAVHEKGLFHLCFYLRDLGQDPPAMMDLLDAILRRFDGWRRLGRMASYTMHDVVLDGRQTESESDGDGKQPPWKRASPGGSSAKR